MYVKVVHAVVVLGIASLPVARAADTHFVSLDGADRCPYTTPCSAARTVQAAMEAADPGDMVDVGAGVFRGEVRMKPRTVLRGAGPGLTIIEGIVWGAEDCVIRDLRVHNGSLALLHYGGQRVDNCEVSGRPSGTGIGLGGGSALRPTSPIVVSRCRVSGMSTGVHLRDAPPLLFLVSCSITGCGTGLAAYWGRGQLVVTGCSISNGVYLDGSWEADVYASSIDGGGGSGLDLADGAHVSLTYCTVSSNRRAGISADLASADLLNCTVFGNDVGIICQDTALSLRNTILWGNVSTDLYPLGDNDISASYSDVGGGFPGQGNIDADPQFVDAENGDFRLMPGSPCIDAGFNDPDLPETDIAGMHRIMFGGKSLTVDMGAYEYYILRLEPGPFPDQVTLVWSSQELKRYSILYSHDLSTWKLADELPSDGNETTSWIDDGRLTGSSPLLVPRRFYRILENP